MDNNIVKESYRQAVVDAGRKLLGSGLTIETWGNISVRDPETSLIYITPSGMPYDVLKPDDIVVCSPDGSVFEGRRVPSVETGLHAGIYSSRKDVNAVLHTHPVSSMVFSVLRKDIPVVTDEIAQAIGSTVRCAEYALPGSRELSRNCLEALGSSQACLLANHGAVCVGATLKECFKVAEVLEAGAEVYYRALAVGTPVVEDDRDVAWMRDFAINKYGRANKGDGE